MFMIVVAGSVFAVMVTVLLFTPSLPDGLKDTFMSLLSPGAIGSFGYSGTVQPQDP